MPPPSKRSRRHRSSSSSSDESIKKSSSRRRRGNSVERRNGGRRHEPRRKDRSYENRRSRSGRRSHKYRRRSSTSSSDSRSRKRSRSRRSDEKKRDNKRRRSSTSSSSTSVSDVGYKTTLASELQKRGHGGERQSQNPKKNHETFQVVPEPPPVAPYLSMVSERFLNAIPLPKVQPPPPPPPGIPPPPNNHAFPIMSPTAVFYHPMQPVVPSTLPPQLAEGYGDMPPVHHIRPPTARPTIFNKIWMPLKIMNFGGDVAKYQMIEQVGEGTYGVVFKAKCHRTNGFVAVKKIRPDPKEGNGFPITAVRELKILQQLEHKNVIDLVDIVTDTNNLDDLMHSRNSPCYLVFEYVEHDLAGLLDSDEIILNSGHIASIFRQMLEGIGYCHERNILHRDIKTSNVLLNNKGEVKLADFGLARLYDKDSRRLYTNTVITLWYRPPEILLGTEQYNESVDLWSLGCILAELFIKKALFKAPTEPDLFHTIITVCGTPIQQQWPDAVKLPRYKMLCGDRVYPRTLKQNPRIKSLMTEDALDLLDRILALNPNHRIRCPAALRHAFVTSDAARQPAILSIAGERHEMTQKALRKANTVKSGSVLPMAAQPSQPPPPPR